MNEITDSKSKPRTRHSRRINRKAALHYAVEQLESRTLLSVTAAVLEASYNTEGTVRTYKATLTKNGVVTTGTGTQINNGQSTFIDPSTMQRISCVEQTIANVQSYYGFDTFGNFVEYGDISNLGSTTETTVYSPARLVAQADSEAANGSVTSNYQNEVTDTNNATAAVISTSTSPGKDVITLKSDTTVPMTVGSITYQTYDFTDVKTNFNNSGGVTSSTSNESWVSPIEGLVKTTFTVTAYNPNGSILNTYTETDQLVSLAVGDHLSIYQPPSDTAVAATIAPPVVVQALNASSVIDTAVSTTLTASITSGTAGAVLSGATTSFSGGVATFSGLSINLPGTYILTFSTANGLSITSNSFNIGALLVTSVSTSDSKSLTVSYNVLANAADTAFPLNVYRDSDPNYIIGAPQAVSIAQLTISGADAMAGNHTITVSPYNTASAPYAFSQALALRPDPTHRYVIATADETGVLDSNDANIVPQNEFRIWLLGVVTHGYVGEGFGPLNSETQSAGLPDEYPGDVQTFVDTFAKELETVDGYDYAFGFHWEEYADLPYPDEATTQGGVMYGDILNAVNRMDVGPVGPNDVIDVNAIGWSRGTIVVNSALNAMNIAQSALPKALASGFICETLVDPHPANNKISGQSTYYDNNTPLESFAESQAADLAIDGYHKFQNAAHDLQGVGFVIPPNVDAVSDMYQHNSAATMSGLSEPLLNLWGLAPSQITPNSTIGPNGIIGKQITTPGIGHAEIMLDVEGNIIQTNQTLQALALYPFGYSILNSPSSLSTPPTAATGTTTPVPAAVKSASPNTAIPRTVTASQLVFTGQAPATVVGNSAFSVTVSAEDGSGNVDTSFTGPVTLALGQNLLDGSLNGTLTVNAVAGVATFNNLSIYQPSVYTLVAGGTGLTSGTSAVFTVTTPAAQQLVIESLTNTVLTNGTFTLTVDAEDAFGTIDTNYSGTVSIALSSPGGGSLAGTLTATATNGVATFTGISINKAGSDEITASSAGLTGGATPWLAVSDDELVVTTSPGDSPLGSSFGLIVSAENSAGVDTSFDGLITLVPSTAPDGSQPVLGGTFARPAIDGTAVFFGLSLNDAGGYTITATADGVAAGQSNGFSITGGAATQLVFANQPSSPVTVGAPLEIDVATEDAQGNLDETFNGPVTLTVATGPGAIGGTTTVNAEDGIATLTGITLGATGSYTLTATGDGFSATTSAITVSAIGVASNLTFTADPPASVTAGATFGVTVTAVDSFGTTDTSFTGPVALSANLDGTPVTTLGGTLTVNAVAGVATFTGLTENTAGDDYTLSATAGELSASIPSGTFAVIAGPATMFVINTTQSVVPGSPFSVTVFAEDALGNTDFTFDGPVTLSLPSTPGQALGGTLTVNAVNGIAAFADLTLSAAGSANTLQATSGSLTGTTMVSASPDQFVVTTSPPDLVATGGAFGLTVSAISAGAVDTSFTGPVTLSLEQLGSTSATLGGTLTVNAVAGMATFSQLTINTAGAYQLAVSSASGAASTTTDTINASSAVSPAASTVVPTFGRLKLPGSGIAGQRFIASIPLSLQATSAVAGSFTIYLYADQTETLDGQQVLLGKFTESVSLKAGKAKTSTLRLKTLPATLPAGTYHVLAEVVDPASGTALVAAPATVTAVAPVVTLAASAAVHPTTAKSGKIVAVTLTLTNSGNIAAAGNIIVTVASSSDGTAAGITGTLTSPPAHAIKITAGGHAHLSFKFKAPAGPATFFPYVSLTLGSATATAVGPMVTV